MKITVNSDHTLSEAIGALRSAFKQYRFLTVNINTGKSRTMSQNALSHAWYTQVAKELQEYTDSEVKCLCKLHVGLPILRGEDEEYNEYCVKFIDPLPYEQKVEAMKYFPCTSLMKTKQLARYLEQVQANYIRRGVELQFPEED